MIHVIRLIIHIISLVIHSIRVIIHIISLISIGEVPGGPLKMQETPLDPHPRTHIGLLLAKLNT